MKKYRKVKTRKAKSRKTIRNRLRSGSKTVKAKLLEQYPYCDICGSPKSLQLHHVYLIRHGFPTKLEHCVLLCPSCHADFHHRWDKYLDETYKANPQADFLKIYNILKKLWIRLTKVSLFYWHYIIFVLYYLKGGLLKC